MSEQSITFSWDGVERRVAQDRRDRHLWHQAALTVSGQRRYARRQADSENYYVDRYSMRWVAISLAFFTLCCLDAVFTLNLIRLGVATEANPVMRILMDHDITMFLVVKYVGTAFGLVVLLTHKNFKLFNRVKVSHILLGFVLMYVLLIKYELWLFSFTPLV